MFEQAGFDEFSLPEEAIADLSSEDRLAYAARLLQSLALHYGVSDYGGRRLGEASDESPAALLRGLNDIQWTPMLP